MSEVNNPIWPEFELIRDFVSILVIGKLDKGQIKHEGVIVFTTISSLCTSHFKPDAEDTVELKCRVLTSASSPQCLWVTAGLLIPRLNARKNFYIYLRRFEQGFWQGFNQKIAPQCRAFTGALH